MIKLKIKKGNNDSPQIKAPEVDKLFLLWTELLKLNYYFEILPCFFFMALKSWRNLKHCILWCEKFQEFCLSMMGIQTDCLPPLFLHCHLLQLLTDLVVFFMEAKYATVSSGIKVWECALMVSKTADQNAMCNSGASQYSNVWVGLLFSSDWSKM